jgi:hypothetical protein
MKTYWENAGIALPILNLGTRLSSAVSFTPRPLYHWIGPQSGGSHRLVSILREPSWNFCRWRNISIVYVIHTLCTFFKPLKPFKGPRSWHIITRRQLQNKPLYKIRGYCFVYNTGSHEHDFTNVTTEQFKPQRGISRVTITRNNTVV